MAADAHGLPLLHTFQKHIEDMRSLVQCKICIKPLYEPFILSCGHCYCYSCLTSWFTGGNGGHRRRQNMKCPDCRAAVVQEPSPNYVVSLARRHISQEIANNDASYEILSICLSVAQNYCPKTRPPTSTKWPKLKKRCR